MTILLDRIAETLPASFSELEVDAKADDHQHMTHLATEFIHNRAMFHAVSSTQTQSGPGIVTPSNL